MDGLLALDLWDIVNEVLRSTNNTVQPKHKSILEAGATLGSKTKTPNVKRRQKVEQLNGVDYVPTSTLSSQSESQLYILEDNEAVIRIMIKGRSPTMRHVSKTLRVALDWLFDRINLEPKIQIKFVDTKNQLADGQGDGVPKVGLQQAAADPRGSSRTCVCANTLVTGVAYAGEVKGELTSCPWYGLVGVASTSSGMQRRVDRAARKSEWSPRGTGTTALTYPCPSQPCFGGSKGCAQVTGKAGENDQKIRRRGGTLILDKTVGSRVW